MKKRQRLAWKVLAGLGVLALVAMATPARAEFYDFSTTVSLTPTTGVTTGTASFTSNPGTPNAFTRTVPTATFTGPNGNQLIFYALNSNATSLPHDTATGGANIVYGDIASANLTPAPNGATDNVSLNFSYTLTLTDYAGANDVAPTGTASTVITGRIDGVIGNNRNATSISGLAFAGPSTLMVGATSYSIDGLSFVNPGSSNDGTLGARITAAAVPEPASLAVLGTTLVGAWGIFRRRKAPK
jgi:hypothetical protein